MGRNWNQEEDDMLRELIAQYGKQWSVIASHMPNRTATQIAARWEKCINPKLTKGPFNPEEDKILNQFVEEYGCHAWPKVTTVLPHRTAKQCRERWFNNLDPTVTKTPWTPEEDDMIFQNYLKFGPKWSTIAHLIPGRTDNSIKNRWNASISKRIRTDTEGNKTLAPCKIRKYSKKNKMLEQGRPEALNIQSLSNTTSNSNSSSSDLPVFTEANIVLPPVTEAFGIVPHSRIPSTASSGTSSGSNTPSRAQKSTLPSPFAMVTPTFEGGDPFNGQELPFSPFGGLNFPTTPDFCSPRGTFKFMQSPLFSPTCGPHAFDDF
ncbi:hypothetical protein M9Y10_008362 [Tritrichomonas musculus]|uniref:Myb-like DNA-binding domain containing protein n=1 Tax=Tritrichomonas musculus TaxID=1915356 RepID=A0ABR2IZ00_9EUKA